MKAEFLKCNICGNIVSTVHKSGAPIICCGEPMQIITDGTVDASKEKHVPVSTVSGNDVLIKVGSEEHPSSDSHFIQWIGLSTDKGFQMKFLKPGDKPQASFRINDDEKVIQCFCYCNLHGKWIS